MFLTTFLSLIPLSVLSIGSLRSDSDISSQKKRLVFDNNKIKSFLLNNFQLKLVPFHVSVGLVNARMKHASTLSSQCFLTQFRHFHSDANHVMLSMKGYQKDFLNRNHFYPSLRVLLCTFNSNSKTQRTNIFEIILNACWEISHGISRCMLGISVLT